MNIRCTALASLAVASVLLSGCAVRESPAVTAEQRVPVRVAEVESARLDATLHAVGSVAPRDEVRLSFKMPGVVASIDVREGDLVRAGQVLAVLEQAEIDAAIRQAAAATAKAERDLARAKALYADGVATREQLQDLTTAFQMARAAQDSAEFNARFTRIEAPADGVVTRRLGEPRELVAAGQPLLVVGATGRGWVVHASLTDRDVVRVQQGDSAIVSLDAWPDRELEGRVTRIGAAADPATGTFRMEVSVDSGELRLAQGLVARVEVRDGREVARPVVPLAALLEADGGKAVVFVVDSPQSLARRVVVATGRFAGDRVEIAHGLVPGQRVVVDGAAYLREGDVVRVLGEG
jgi:multidrug efflux system membrane fusion protein